MTITHEAQITQQPSSSESIDLGKLLMTIVDSELGIHTDQRMSYESGRRVIQLEANDGQCGPQKIMLEKSPKGNTDIFTWLEDDPLNVQKFSIQNGGRKITTGIEAHGVSEISSRGVEAKGLIALLLSSSSV